MRRLLLAFMPAGLARGVIVDGIAVTVGTKVITSSEIEWRIRLTAFENASAPSFDHFGAEGRGRAADRSEAGGT